MALQIPNEPSRGMPITAVWGAQVVRLLRALIPRESPDLIPTMGPGGTSYRLKYQLPGGAGPDPEIDFQLYDAGKDDNNNPQLACRPGTIAPQGSLQLAAGVMPYPSQFVPGEDYICNPSASDTMAWIELDFTPTDGTHPALIDSISFSTGTQIPDVSGGSIAVLILGSFAVKSDQSISVQSSGVGSQRFMVCDTAGYFYT